VLRGQFSGSRKFCAPINISGRNPAHRKSANRYVL